MHFITGGAYNGKRKWVRALYEPKQWISAYHNHPLPVRSNDFSEKKIVLEGIEMWIKNDVESRDGSNIRANWKTYIQSWREWEREEEDRLIIMIGTDISKGIVPMNKLDRTWRDVTGWIYQDLTDLSNRVDIIWYGLNQQLK
ncbi:bifunctional adenosylcobinamide kinase/adenosylcobinamide-phosphate guanylyltransferase [Peribacillus huizhouensis]|uniref:Adenosyl cobinamide kinase/adenosyl cobinamide phosphate guanylyltransferase n=1 Tax=Peribacillus huizhouensis TaxID=1501239 RepID=A0ABR6CSG0_9BACI|nr:bifunctional adenosylcobinamide kinase/adenosylcobinamide-phosphate guanylyltransferase [Peribacillus huizhouensis]MBA9027955.1 adenosyl cobinamide kinase/adenosyl cobinamide phosphate guanylyltransferase [Peribacillus huizhouensis]